jgi:uncharacterized protein
VGTAAAGGRRHVEGPPSQPARARRLSRGPLARTLVARRCHGSLSGVAALVPEPQISVVDDPAHSRYELRVDGEVAGQLVYRTDGTRRTLVHTEIDPAFEGQGLGSHLAAGALDDARQRGFTVVPLCPFVTAYLRRHHEELDVVEEPYRTRLGAG